MRPHALPLAVLLGTCLTLSPPTRAADPAPATRPAIAVAALPSVPDADRLADLIRGLTQGKNPQCAPQDEFERGVGRSDLADLLRELGHRDAARREAEQMDRVVATLPADDQAALQDSLAYALAAGDCTAGRSRWPAGWRRPTGGPGRWAPLPSTSSMTARPRRARGRRCGARSKGNCRANSPTAR